VILFLTFFSAADYLSDIWDVFLPAKPLCCGDHAIVGLS
jgi:hypothetical protein